MAAILEILKGVCYKKISSQNYEKGNASYLQTLLVTQWHVFLNKTIPICIRYDI